MSETIQPVTLGAFIEAMEQMPEDKPVSFDFVGFGPTTLDSYRGYYDHLAFGYDQHNHPTVREVLKWARDAVGQTFEGYKGGEYVMGDDTPLWVSNYGESHDTCVIGVFDAGYYAMIATGFCREWDGAAMRAYRVLFQGLGFGNRHLRSTSVPPTEEA